ncbi:MAG: hypothetical protein AAF497_14225 [Planctomycetota bacterium]
MTSISLFGIAAAAVAVFFAYQHGYAAGFESGRDEGFGDGKREGSREGSMRGYAVGFDRGRRHRDDDDDGGDDNGGRLSANGQLGVAVFALVLIAMFIALMTQNPATGPEQGTAKVETGGQPHIPTISSFSPMGRPNKATRQPIRMVPDEPRID